MRSSARCTAPATWPRRSSSGSLVELAQRLHRGARGEVAADRTADAVADREQPRTGVPAVLVLPADASHVGDRGVVEEHHFRSSRIVLPTRTWTPRPMVVGWVMRTGPDVGAVGGAEVLDEPLVATGGDAGVAGGDVVVVELDGRVAAAADEERGVGELGAGAGVLALDHEEVGGGAAAGLLVGLGAALAALRRGRGAASGLRDARAEHVGADHRDRGEHEDPEDREERRADQEEGQLRHSSPRPRRGRRRCGPSSRCARS